MFQLQRKFFQLSKKPFPSFPFQNLEIIKGVYSLPTLMKILCILQTQKTDQNQTIVKSLIKIPQILFFLFESKRSFNRRIFYSRAKRKFLFFLLKSNRKLSLNFYSQHSNLLSGRISFWYEFINSRDSLFIK